MVLEYLLQGSWSWLWFFVFTYLSRFQGNGLLFDFNFLVGPREVIDVHLFSLLVVAGMRVPPLHVADETASL